MRVWPLLVIAALLSSCSTTERAHTDAELSQLVARASQDRAHLVKRFAAPHGFIGVIVQGNDPGARQTTGWVTAGGEYLLVGSLFDAHGRNVADAPLGQRGSGGLTSQEFMRRVQAAEAVTQFPTGTGARLLPSQLTTRSCAYARNSCKRIIRHAGVSPCALSPRH